MEMINIRTGGCMVKTRIYTCLYISGKIVKEFYGCTPVSKTSAGL